VRKLIIIVLFVAGVLALLFIPQETIATASTTGTGGAETELRESIDEILKGIDFGDLDKIASDLTDADFNVFRGDDFATRVGKILTGEFVNDYPNILLALLALFGGVVLDVLPIVFLIVAISLLCGFLNSIKSNTGEKGVGEVVHFVALAAVITIVMVFAGDLAFQVGRVLGSIKTQMDIIFPILLTLMAATGGAVSSGVYQPAVVMLSTGVMQIFTYVVMPLFFITLVFGVVGNLSPNIKLDKFASFFTSAFKWIVGVVFTVFLAFLTIQGITAAAHDGVSIRAAKLTISSYVPFLGGYISQGFDLVLASSMLIKNAVGVAGLYLLLGVVLAPVIKIAVFMLALKLAAAITQPIGDARISNFLTSINKAFGMLVAVLVGAAFMYFLCIGLVILSGNII
jgi:stage III sporulation protein AE